MINPFLRETSVHSSIEPTSVVPDFAAATDDPLPTNAWGQAPLRPLEASEMIVAPGVAGGAYQHHPHLTAAPDGRLLLSWSRGDRDEDMQGQEVVWSFSDDAGRTWSPPRTLVEPTVGPLGPLVLTNGGIHAHAGGLTAYAGCYQRTYLGMLMYYACGGHGAPSSPGQRLLAGTTTWVLASNDAGRGWERVGRLDGGIVNHPPQRLRSGRLIMPGHVSFPYTDDPAGIDGWARVGLPGLPDDHADDPEQTCVSEGVAGADPATDPRCFGEGTLFETDDGVVRMMLRGPAERLYLSESRDDGRSWSPPRPTDYTDCRSRSQFGRLPDGRFFGLNTPKPHSPRTPLVLALSTDGVRFDRPFLVGDRPNVLPRIHGVHKYGRYGYPSLCVLEETVFVAYSINKEDIAVTRFALAELDA